MKTTSIPAIGRGNVWLPTLGVASFAASKLKASVLACIYRLSSLRGTKQSSLSPSGGGVGGGLFHFQFSVFSFQLKKFSSFVIDSPPSLRGTKQSILTLLLFLFLSFASCCTNSDVPSSRIFVRVSNECVCNLFLYTSEGLCLQSKIWDCQETTYLTFDVFQEGQFTIKAEYRDRSASQTLTAQLDKTYEVDIIF